MIAVAMEAEITVSMEPYRQIKTPDGNAAVVRNGDLPERPIISTAGPLMVKVLRNRSFVPSIKPFVSVLIPRYLRKTQNIEAALPLFYLGGPSNKDLIPSIEQLFGELSAGFSSASMTRIKQIWLEEHRKWNCRPMHLVRYCYLWFDGIHFNLRIDEGRLCVLVVMGSTEDGKKKLLAVAGGYRESAESWLELLRDLKERSMPSPKLCVGDGALGFWKALGEVYPATER